MSQSLPPTGLVEIRNFLINHQCAPTPWEKPDHVVDRLYAALCDKRRDERFWYDLRELMNRLEDERFHDEAIAGAQVLTVDSLDKLIDDLRRSLPENGNGNGNGRNGNLKKWLSHSMSATALLAFLVLGAAATLNDNGGSRQAALSSVSYVEATMLPDGQPQFNDAAPADELLQVINQANVSNRVKSDLLSCLPELDAAYRSALLDKFQVMDDAQLASFLEAMSQTDGVRHHGFGAMSTDDGGATGSSDAASGGTGGGCGCAGDDDDDDDDDDYSNDDDNNGADDDDNGVDCETAWNFFDECGYSLSDMSGNKIDVQDIVYWCETGEEFYGQDAYYCLVDFMGNCDLASDCIDDALNNEYDDDSADDDEYYDDDDDH